MKRFKRLLIVALLVGSVSIAYAQETITPEVSAKFIGRQETVCGTVVVVHYATRRNGQPTLMNFDQSYPNQMFTVLIWGSDRGKFEKPPEKLYGGKDICVTGMIEDDEGRPEIVVKDPSQIKFMKQPAHTEPDE
ncbi:MAG: DNA-binding protein [Syntrophobacteraceae bacterium]|jgi:micrococcal nuclease